MTTSFASIVIPTYDNNRFLVPCLESLEKQTVSDIEVIVVNNKQNPISTLEIRQQFPWVYMINLNHNGFFCESVNIGIRASKSRFVAVLNDDTRVSENWLEKATEPFKWDTDLGSVASKVLSMRNPMYIDSAGDQLMPNGIAGNIGHGCLDSGQFSRPDYIFSASGAAAVYDRELLLRLDCFDEFLTAYYDDIDLGFRAQLVGRSCIYNPNAVVFHYGSASNLCNRYKLILAERNMVWTLLKNMPSDLLRKYVVRILNVMSSPLRCNDGLDWQAWARGKIMAAHSIRRVMKQRKQVMRTRRVSINYLDSLLNKYNVSPHL